MNGPVRFGDLLDAAARHLHHAREVHGRSGDASDVPDVTGGMHALVREFGRYLRDCTGTDGRSLQVPGGRPSAWPTACAQARRAAANALRYLAPAPAARRTLRSPNADSNCMPLLTRSGPGVT